MAAKREAWEPVATYTINDTDDGGTSLTVGEHNGGTQVVFCVTLKDGRQSVVHLTWQQVDALVDILGNRYGSGKLRRVEPEDA